MTRKKVNLAYITNDAARKATYKKRKVGLIKKVSELSTLCGVDACAIIYSPFESRPEVWPSPSGVQRVLAQFKQMPELEQSKKMMNQEGFLRLRINKATDQLKKLRKDNREKEITEVMYQSLTGKSLLNLNMIDLTDLGWIIDQTIMEINKKNENQNNGGLPPYQPLLLEARGLPPHQPLLLEAPPAPPSVALEAGPYGVQHEPPMLQQPPQQMQEEADQRSPFLENLESQQWFQELTVPTPPPPPQEPMMFGGDEFMMPPGDISSPNTFWSSGFFQ